MSLGPVVVTLPRLFFLLGLLTVILAAHWFERRTGKNVETPIWWSILVGVVLARLSYVATHLSDYRDQPLQALYFWQDGYLPLAGMAATVVAALLFSIRRSQRAKPLLVPLLAGILIWSSATWVSRALIANHDARLPELTVREVSGTPVALAGFRGQPVVLNLWATWCPPCRREMPVLAQAQQARNDVHLVFLNQGEEEQVVRHYLATEALPLRNVLLDSQRRAGREFSTVAMPTTLFFDAEGKLVDTHVGELSRARLSDYLRRIAAP